MPYTVFLDDARRYRDPSERTRFGTFNRQEDAAAAAKLIIDDGLARLYRPEFMADDLLSLYETFASRPVIEPAVEGFSPDAYAKQRCAVLCPQGVAGHRNAPARES